MKKVILSASIIINFLLIGAAIYKYTNTWKRKENAKTGVVFFLGRDKLYEVLHINSTDFVFVGHSQIQNFPLEEFFANYSVKNRGINQDVAAGVLARLSPLIEGKPRKIFIEIGVNDIGYGVTKEDFLKSYEEILKRIHEQSPHTQIFVLSILPVRSGLKTFPTYYNEVKNEVIEKWNSDLKLLSDRRSATYVDCFKFFQKKGALDKKYDVDGVHLTADGYRNWVNVIEPFLK